MNHSATRRGFIGAAAAGLAATSTVTGARPEKNGNRTGAKPGFKLGVASYSFRKLSREKAIEMTKQLGTPYINIKEYHLPINSTPEEIAAARKQFADAGLIILGGGNISFQQNDEADIRHKFDYAKAAGMPVIVCAPTHETLPKLEKYVKEYNIKIAVHNHGPEDKNFPTPQSVLDAVKNMDPRCGLCIDVGHTVRTGADVVESVRNAGPRLHDMHMKDLASFDRESQVPVGEGKVPVAALFRELTRMNYTGGVMLEYEIEPDNPLPGMQKSFAYMRGVIAGMQV